MDRYTTIEKLTGPDNYQAWVFQVSVLLKAKGAFKVATGGSTLPQDAAGQAEWYEKDAKAQKLFITTVERKVLTHLMGCANSLAMWNKLKATYEMDTDQQRCSLLQKFSRNYVMAMRKQLISLFTNSSEALPTQNISPVSEEELTAQIAAKDFTSAVFRDAQELSSTQDCEKIGAVLSTPVVRDHLYTASQAKSVFSYEELTNIQSQKQTAEYLNRLFSSGDTLLLHKTIGSNIINIKRISDFETLVKSSEMTPPPFLSIDNQRTIMPVNTGAQSAASRLLEELSVPVHDEAVGGLPPIAENSGCEEADTEHSESPPNRTIKSLLSVPALLRPRKDKRRDIPEKTTAGIAYDFHNAFLDAYYKGEEIDDLIATRLSDEKPSRAMDIAFHTFMIGIASRNQETLADMTCSIEDIKRELSKENEKKDNADLTENILRDLTGKVAILTTVVSQLSQKLDSIQQQPMRPAICSNTPEPAKQPSVEVIEQPGLISRAQFKSLSTRERLNYIKNYGNTFIGSDGNQPPTQDPLEAQMREKPVVVQRKDPLIQRGVLASTKAKRIGQKETALNKFRDYGVDVDFIVSNKEWEDIGPQFFIQVKAALEDLGKKERWSHVYVSYERTLDELREDYPKTANFLSSTTDRDTIFATLEAIIGYLS